MRPLTTFQLLRAFSRTPEDIARYLGKRRVRKVAEAKAYREQKSEEKLLDAEISRLKLKIDSVERSDALGYYVQRGLTMTEALSSYRSLLNAGGRLPASKEICSKYGLELRRTLGQLTKDDRAYLNALYLKGDKRNTAFLFLASFVLFGAGLMAALKAEDFGLTLLAWFVAGVVLVAAVLLRNSVRRREGSR